VFRKTIITCSFPEHVIQELRYKRHTNSIAHNTTTPPLIKRWSKFQFHGPTVHKITNLFKNTNVKLAFKATNTIFHQLTRKPKKDNPPGIYRLCCNTCKKSYVGQTGRDVTTRYKEHVRYIKNNKLISAYSMHILNTRTWHSNIHIKTTEALSKKAPP
jgi:hypothetical protein